MAGQFYDIGKFKPSVRPGRMAAVSQGQFRSGLLGTAGERYHLALRDVQREHLVESLRRPEAQFGLIQNDYADNLSLVEALAAAAVASHGRGNLLVVPEEGERKAAKPGRKIEVDRAAAAVHGVLGHELFSLLGVSAVHRQTEGARWKPGETGANPANFRDQILGGGEVRVFVNRDNVDGTGLTTENRNNGVTASQYLASDLKGFLPDLYALSLSSSRGLSSTVTVDSTLGEIVEALRRAHELEAHNELLLAALKRPRQEEVQKALAALNVSFVRMSDGNVVPGISAGLRFYPFPSGSLLHGTFDSGGAPEAMLLAPLLWLGGSVNVSPASKDGFKTWEGRRKFSTEELQLLAEGRIDPYTSFPLETLFVDPRADGIALMGGITQNDWVPALKGVEFGATAVQVSVWRITSGGSSAVDHFIFDYTDGEAATRAGFTPLVSHIREAADETGIRDRVQTALQEDRQAARIQFEQDFYLVLDRRGDQLTVDRDAFAALQGSGRYDAKDKEILSAFIDKTDWFATS